MNIVFHSSDSFASVAAVSIVSIMKNNNDCSEIIFYAIENKISEKNKEKISKMVKEYNRKIVFIPMPNIQKEYGLIISQIKKKWIFDSYCRLFLGTLLPESVNRVLYLDADTLCNQSLTDLWNTDLEDNYCAGVIDCVGEPYYSLFEMSDKSYYCNSGMVLFDLKKWRKDRMENKVVNYVNRKNGYIFFMEQSVMNIVLDGKIKILSPKFNVYSLIPSFTYENLHLLRKSKRFYSKKEIKEAMQNPVIIHFTGLFCIKGRPWMNGCQHPYKDLFLKYKKMTPWYKEELNTLKISHWRSLVYTLIDIIPQKIVALFVGIIYNYIRPFKISSAQKKYWNLEKS